MFSSNQSNVAPIYNFIEDVFSTYLYTGTGATQTITNGIDLSTKGGLTWIKGRSGATGHRLTDTVRGVTKSLASETTAAEATETTGLTAFGTTGFTIGADTDYNTSAATYASWTFREQAKFFDVVTYTGTGSALNVAHNLGSTPGCVIVKDLTNGTRNWLVWHRSLTFGNSLRLNLTNAQSYSVSLFGNGTIAVDPTSTQFTVGDSTQINASGNQYIAYIFAHDAGGFGLTGTDNVISCGTFTTDGGANADVTLGYEPQFVITKSTSVVDWYISDVMRDMSVTNSRYLIPNTSGAEVSNGSGVWIPTATGLQIRGLGSGGDTHIYIAIRRGPMAVPTLGTSVFGLSARSGTGADATVTGGQTDDAVLVKNRGAAVASLFSSRLTGTGYLVTSTTAAEVAAGVTILQANPWDVMDGVKVGTTSTITNASANTYINYLFKRAPSFFDEVCYTGTGVATTQTHNLGVVPELMIFKSRSDVRNWIVYSSTLGATKNLRLNATDAEDTNTYWDNTTPTASVFSIDSSIVVNASASTFVAYLFATCAGVSKVGSYAGTGATQTIDCGFGAGGARFVLVKRTDSTGDWYVWDTARGMISGTDPSLLWNTTAAEVNANSIYTIATGFQIVSTAAGINSSASGATYIFLAIA